jgi:hypothetical protein
LSCTGLTTELDRIEAALKAAKEAKAQAEKTLKGVEDLLKDIDSGFVINKLQSLIQKFENWKYNVQQPLTDQAVANTKKQVEKIKEQVKGLSATIADLESQRQKVKDKLKTCTNPPCTASLERSSGTPPYTAANHIRVRASCGSGIKKIVVKSLSADTFDACAQTSGTGTGCTASGDTLTSTWNQPANQELELYGRVTANADGNYQVTVYGDGDAVLHQFQATVAP